DGKLQIDNAVLEATSSKLKPNAVLDFLRRNSRIYGVFTETGLVLSLNEPLYRKINRWYTGIASRFEKNDRAGTWTVPYGPQKPMEVTGALIKALAAESGKDGSKFILAMFPNAVGDPEYMQQEAQYEIMARKQGFSYIDLTGPVMNRPDSKSMFLQYHFSSKGHALVAERLQPIVESLVSESQLPAANPQ
ncbi:MAG TPA: hypothetical protein V6C72_13770, partial [Chroococcales cyanobacterium]